jgi:hypothetical protein
MKHSFYDLVYLAQNNPEERDLCLEFALPYSNGEHCETIVVPAKYIPAKIQYISGAYNFSNLTGKHNKAVKIIKFYLK